MAVSCEIPVGSPERRTDCGGRLTVSEATVVEVSDRLAVSCEIVGSPRTAGVVSQFQKPLL